MTRTFLAAAIAAVVGITACGTGSGDAARTANPNLASYSLVDNGDLGNDFTGNFVWIRGTRSVAADGKYPCLSEFQACVPTDQAGKTLAIQDLCPSTDTPEGTWSFEYYLAADKACAEPLGNLYCEIERGEWLQPGANSNQVRCTTRNAEKTFDFCVYDPVTGAGLGQCTKPIETVLVVASDIAGWPQDVQAKLIATGAFTKVDVFDAMTTTPSVAELLAYDAVLAYSDFTFADPVALGDNLASYYDAGGNVVTAVFATTDPNAWGLRGRFASDYMLVEQLPRVLPGPDVLGLIAEPGSPLLMDVTFFRADEAARSPGGVKNGGIAVAYWEGGPPLVVRGVIAGRNRVDLNFFPPSSDAYEYGWTGNGAELMRNALQFQ
jgi:hypothetical protein